MIDPIRPQSVNEQISSTRYQALILYPLKTPFPVPEHFQEALKEHAAEMAYLPVAGQIYFLPSSS